MAKIKLFRYLTMSLLFLCPFIGIAQDGLESNASDSIRYDEVRSLVNFYEYMLNTIGSAKSSTRDKEVIIRESYKKIFINQEVQIEDDLILDRKVITNKDVSAYLRDVDFFFKEIHIDFENIEIQKVVNEDSSFYFLVSFENKVSGTTIDDEIHSHVKNRFIEVNLDENTDDLKIVSIYSTKVSRERELEIWWASLPYDWIEVFKSYILFDEISAPVLLRIAAIDSLNLSGNQGIINIDPLAALKGLKKLDISYSKITELSPLRYARNLKILNAAYTPIADISTLQYFEKLTTLDLSHTEIVDMSPIGRQNELTLLDLSSTKIINFDALKDLHALEEINLSSTSFSDASLLSSSLALEMVNISKTEIADLTGFKKLQQLRELGISETKITSLTGLENHPTLETLSINHTSITTLESLMKVPNLKKVYADFTDIHEDVASLFMSKKYGTVVITNSEEVIQWWNELPVNWKSVFNEIITKEHPSKDDIIKLLNLDSLDVSNQGLIEGVLLRKFKRLRYLDISFNEFTSFDFTDEMEDLEILKGIGLPIESSKGLEKNLFLKQLILNESSLVDIESLAQLSRLKLLDVNDTNISDVQVVKCLNTNPNLVIIYQSDALRIWWKGLAHDWKNTFNIDGQNTFELHQLIEQKEIFASSKSISSLVPLDVFINLEKITLDGVRIGNIDELYKHHNLRELSWTNSPLQSLEDVAQFSKLEYLDISNTAIEDLKSISGMSSLKHLNCSGTSIKNLKAITRLYGLQSLDVSNTRIWRLEWLYEMKDMKIVVCNNTKLNQQKVDAYQLLFPDCEVTFY